MRVICLRSKSYSVESVSTHIRNPKEFNVTSSHLCPMKITREFYSRERGYTKLSCRLDQQVM